MNRRAVASIGMIAATLLAAAVAHADEPSAVGRATAHMAVDFCGAVVGTDPTKLEERVVAMPEFAVGLPLKASSPEAQKMIGKLLTIGPDDPFHRLTYKGPPSEPPLLGSFRPDLKSCGTVVIGASDAAAAIRARVEAPDSGWTAILADPPLLGWQRKGDNDQFVTLTLLGSPESTIVSVDSLFGVMPTRAQVNELANAIVTPCAKLVLSDTNPRDAGFASPLEFTGDADSKGKLTLSARGIGFSARLVLVPEKKTWSCVTEIHVRSLPLDPFTDSIRQSYRSIPGLNAAQGKNDRQWTLTDPATRRSALMMLMSGKDVLYVTIFRK